MKNLYTVLGRTAHKTHYSERSLGSSFAKVIYFNLIMLVRFFQLNPVYKEALLSLKILVVFISIGFGSLEQSVSTTYANNNGFTAAVFTFYNGNSYSISINSIGTYAGSTGTQTAQFWTKPRTGYNQGTNAAVSVANGWTLQASQSIATTANTTGTVGASAPIVLSGMNVIIPAGAYFSFAVSLSNSLRYSTLNAQAGSFTANGCTIDCSAQDGFGGTLASPTNTPRAFIGTINFTPLTACTGTPNAGVAALSSSSGCLGASVNVSATGITTGTGITYQWQSSTNGTTWSNIVGATSSTYTATPSVSTYYRLVTTCTNSGATNTSSSILYTVNCYQMGASGASITACSGTLYDNGGTGDYGNSLNSTITIYPATAGNMVSLNFSAFATENNWDGLVIYNGNSTAAAIISSGLAAGTGSATNCPAGSYYGTVSPGTVTSTSADGSLTLQFRSDGSGVAAGFVASISCVAPPACSAPSSLTSSSITGTGATISWTAASPAPASGYQYYVSTSSTAPTAGTTPTGSTAAGVTTANLTGLSANTTYYFWVRSNCGGSGTSTWAGSSSFLTVPALVTGISGTSNTCGNGLNLTWTASPGAGAYYVIVDQNPTYLGSFAGNTTVYTNSASITGLTANTTYYAHIAAVNTAAGWSWSGSSNSTAIITGNSSSPSNESCSGAINLIAGASATSGTLNCATFNNYFTTKKDVWYKFTPSCTGSYTVTLSGLPDDKDLYYFAACDATSAVAISSNGGTTNETITQNFIGGVTYYFAVYDFANSGGNFNIAVSSGTSFSNPAPSSIVGSASVCANTANTVYSVTNVSGNTYNWTLPSGWSLISGSNTNSITVNAGVASGTISVTASGTCGTSSPSSLTITTKPLPTVNAGADQSICLGQSTTLAGSANPTMELIAGQVMLNDGFENGLSNWTSSIVYMNQNWAATGGYSGQYSAHSGSLCAYYQESDYDYSEAYISYNLNPNYSNVNVSFYYINPEWSGDQDWGYFEYFDGLNWLTLGAYETSITSWTYQSFDLPAIATKIRFYGAAAYGYGFSIDDVLITGTVASLVNPTYYWGSSTGLSSTAVYNPVANPIVTTTYTLTATSASGCSFSDQVLITVNSLPIVAITPSANALCSGQSSTLTASGANSYQWNTTETTTSIIVSSANTYSVIGTDGNGCTASANTTISANAAPTVSAGADKTICIGNSVTLSGSGAATYTWSNGVTNGTAFTPTTTATYTVTGTDLNGCTNTDQVVVTLPTAGTALSQNNEDATCTVNQNGWVHFYHSSGRLIGSINSQGQDLGAVTATSYVEGAPVSVDACGNSNPIYATTVMGRHWVITPTNQPASPVLVRLPFTNAELSVLQIDAFNNANTNDDISSVSDVGLTKYSNGSAANVNNIASDNCGVGASTFHTQMGNNSLNNSYSNFAAGLGYYTDFSIPGFSEFWLHGSAQASPLPVELVNFQANCAGEGKVNVTWATASEHNSANFTVEKSRDGINWAVLATVAGAGNSTQMINYSVDDNNASAGVNYYRLTQTDVDGAFETFNIASANCGDNSTATTVKVYPNPSAGDFYIDFNSEEIIGSSVISITDARGMEVYKMNVTVEKGSNVFHIENMEAAPGIYYIQVSNGTATSNIVKHSLR